MQIKSVRKAIVAVVGVAIAFGLLDDETAQSVVGVLTALAVYIVPND